MGFACILEIPQLMDTLGAEIARVERDLSQGIELKRMITQIQLQKQKGNLVHYCFTEFSQFCNAQLNFCILLSSSEEMSHC